MGDIISMLHLILSTSLQGFKHGKDMYISINPKSRHGPYNNIIDMHIVAIHRELHVWVCILLHACTCIYNIDSRFCLSTS